MSECPGVYAILCVCVYVLVYMFSLSLSLSLSLLAAAPLMPLKVDEMRPLKNKSFTHTVTHTLFAAVVSQNTFFSDRGYALVTWAPEKNEKRNKKRKRKGACGSSAR